jgi:glycosyltransferase involved in cell wall biosynthesis
MMLLKDKITIVVPCKNEENYISYLLEHLKEQNIGNTRVIIADCSTDNTRQVINENKGQLNIEIIDGGPVSIAKNNGAKLATTPYILFIDADVRFFSDTVILDTVEELEKRNLDLIGLRIKCYDKDKRTQIGFMLFNAINIVMSKKVPFAVGAYTLTRKEKFDEYGGFAEKYGTSEDFFLSKQYDPKKFKLVKHYFGQDSRRFKRMGYTGMAMYLVKNFVNRNNEQYWDNLDYSKYWETTKTHRQRQH